LVDRVIAMRGRPLVSRLAVLALASLPALALAQQPNTLQPPPRVAPIAPSAPPSLPRGVDTSRDNSLQTLNASSMRRAGVLAPTRCAARSIDRTG